MDKDLWKEIDQQEKIPDEIWEEIEKIFIKHEERQSGDVDYRDIMERFGICQSTARARMIKLVASGKYRYIWTRGENNRLIQVIRRI